MCSSSGDTPERVKAHVLISGLVQGVYFRDSARRLALREGVGGWIRNLPDGRVEAVFVGPRAAVERLVEWCHQGPPAARVERVDVEWSPADPAERVTAFSIR
ncbi:MAG: acylphosphatase [Chloroflexota bacterium]